MDRAALFLTIKKQVTIQMYFYWRMDENTVYPFMKHYLGIK